jgi:hypothetical protein
MVHLGSNRFYSSELWIVVPSIKYFLIFTNHVYHSWIIKCWILLVPPIWPSICSKNIARNRDGAGESPNIQCIADNDTEYLTHPTLLTSLTQEYTTEPLTIVMCRSDRWFVRAKEAFWEEPAPSYQVYALTLIHPHLHVFQITICRVLCLQKSRSLSTIRKTNPQSPPYGAFRKIRKVSENPVVWSIFGCKNISSQASYNGISISYSAWNRTNTWFVMLEYIIQILTTLIITAKIVIFHKNANTCLPAPQSD